MSLLLALCVLLPIALLAEEWIARREAQGTPSGSFARMTDWPSPKNVARLLAGALSIVVVATAIGTLVDEAPFLFDDSFISYRYAANLAHGHGLRWNPGEAPSEGYTNLLLVLLVAPVIALGGDPLFAARTFSLIAALGIALLLFRMARRELGADRPVAVILALGITVSSFTIELSMLGLETVIFTAFLFFSYYLAQRFFDDGNERSLLASGAVGFVAFLLRPEVVFLPASILAATVLLDSSNRKRCLRVGMLLATSFGLPLALYLAWKLWYFGSIIPNPAFVKMPGAGLLSERGTASVGLFLKTHLKVVVAAAIGLLYSRGRVRAALTCSLVALAYLLFYLRVDTLMDMHTRFLYPAFPFLFVIALPALRAFVDRFLAWRQAPVIRLAIGALLFMLVFYEKPGEALGRIVSRGRPGAVTDREVHQASLVLRRIGRELGTYDRIAEVTIGSTDAGLVPYLSGARHVNMAGLVTRFIAVNKDPRLLSDYFFGQKPDLIIVRAKIGGELIRYEHGVLGDYTRWSHHPGWNAYAYVGGIRNGPRHDLHFFVRSNGRHAEALERIVRDRLRDPDVAPISVVMGTLAQP